MENRVRIGTCSGPADAAFVRSVFEAHQIHFLISGEQHASMMGVFGGGLTLEILVSKDDEEQATALLRDIRDSDRSEADGGEPDQSEFDASPDADRETRTHPDEGMATFDDRRRRTAIALLLMVTLGHGAAHMYTGAWLRGMMLAGVRILGYAWLIQAPGIAFALVIGSVVADGAGAVWRIWAKPTRPRTGASASTTTVAASR
jgi:hypothetical protein